jgi:hypothetical protein
VVKAGTGLPVVATFNGYYGLCPKRSMLKCEKEECKGDGFFKCAYCFARSRYFGKMESRLLVLAFPLLWWLHLRARSAVRSLSAAIAYSHHMKALLDRLKVKTKVIPNFNGLK